MIYDGSHASVEWILASFYSRSRNIFDYFWASRLPSAKPLVTAFLLVIWSLYSKIIKNLKMVLYSATVRKGRPRKLGEFYSYTFKAIHCMPLVVEMFDCVMFYSCDNELKIL